MLCIWCLTFKEGQFLGASRAEKAVNISSLDRVSCRGGVVVYFPVIRHSRQGNIAKLLIVRVLNY